MKRYVSTAFLQAENSQLYAIFAWSQREKQPIYSQTWLTVLEIFIHEHSIEKAYEIFQRVREQPLLDSVSQSLQVYQKFIHDNAQLIVFLGDEKLTLFGKGFRSFIEKEMEFELAPVSLNSYQVLRYLFGDKKFSERTHTIDNIQDFISLVEHLDNLGLLSPSTGSIDWGDLKKTVPICQAFGLTRGTPVDRYYLNQFLQEIRHEIMGNVLEIGGTPKDKDFYQIEGVSSYKILNLEPGLGVDIVGDVHDPSIIKSDLFDTIIIFNVLEHCYAPWIAVENIYKWLKKGGKCFAMVPSAIRVHATPMDYWRPLPNAFSWMFKEYSNSRLYVYGNPMTVLASYYGIAMEELTSEELNAFHPDYPVATCIVAEK